MKKFMLISLIIIVLCFMLSFTIERNNDLDSLFTKEEIEFIKTNKIEYSDFSNYLPYKNFNIFNYYEYEKLRTNNYLEAINLYNNKDYYNGYENIEKAINLNTLNILVNKHYFLEKTFIPTSLVSCSNYQIKYIKRENEIMQGNSEALKNLELLFQEAYLMNYDLYLFSGYRTYEKQKYIYYDLYDGKNEYVSKPGHSEHQTGLAFDISELNYGLITDFSYSPCYKWLKENAYKYGFIERYPLDKENITLYSYEPWHFRYVGINVSTYIYNNNYTFEEYIIKNIEL